MQQLGQVDPYLFPARGRKPVLKSTRRYGNKLKLIPTFSPQGDGNLSTTTMFSPAICRRLIPTFSPQGDGNPRIVRRPPAFLKPLIPTFSPQGDGNMKRRWWKGVFQIRVDPYLFPARGRKRREVRRPGPSTQPLIPTFSPQGDGNTPVSSFLTLARTIRKLIPTFSPQGDGNSPHHPVHPSRRDVDPYLFPARGRKHDATWGRRASATKR